MSLQDKTSTIIIGDVHGCYFTLRNLLKQLPKNSQIIFIGDMCDRGNYSKEVIEFIIHNHYSSLLGNHESYMLDSIDLALTNQPNRWIDESYMGGQETLKSYKNSHECLAKHLAWMQQLPLYLITGSYFLTHAFALPYFERRDIPEKKHSFLVNRVKDIEEWGHDFEEGYENYPLVNIFGHETFEDVFIQNNLYGIDTGCVYGNKLTAIELESMKIYDAQTHPLDLFKITAVDIAEYLELYTKQAVQWSLEDEEITFDIPLPSTIIDIAMQNMPLALKEFCSMFSIDMTQKAAMTSLRFHYTATQPCH